MKITAITKYDEWNKRSFTTSFEVVKELPEIGNYWNYPYSEERVIKIKEVYPKWDEIVEKYKFFEIKTVEENAEENTKEHYYYNICIEKPHYVTTFTSCSYQFEVGHIFDSWDDFNEWDDEPDENETSISMEDNWGDEVEVSLIKENEKWKVVKIIYK